jgi:putative FmdB family regulatory protein
MPTYQYQCKECGVSFERFQHFSEEPLKTCPECSGHVFRVIQPVGVIFKGKGFYVTDHRGGVSPATAPVSDKNDKGDKKAAEETKPESNPEAKPKAETATPKKESPAE